MSNATRRFEFVCKCGTKNQPVCRKCGSPYVFDPVNLPGEKVVRRNIGFPESLWKRLVARQRITPGVSSVAEMVRLAVYDVLSSPPGRVI